MKSLQLEKPHAIVVIGIQGSGKSFFAEKFADTFSAPFIDESAFATFAHDESASKSITNHVLKEMLKTKATVVIESSGSKADRVELSQLVKKAGYEVLLVWVQTDTHTAMGRVRKQTSATKEEFEDNVKRFSAPSGVEQALVISGKHTFATQAKTVLKKLSGDGRPLPKAESRGVVPARHRGNITIS